VTVSHKESECDQSHLHGQPGSVLSVLDPEVGMGVWIHCGSVLSRAHKPLIKANSFANITFIIKLS